MAQTTRSERQAAEQVEIRRTHDAVGDDNSTTGITTTSGSSAAAASCRLCAAHRTYTSGIPGANVGRLFYLWAAACLVSFSSGRGLLFPRLFMPTACPAGSWGRGCAEAGEVHRFLWPAQLCQCFGTSRSMIRTARKHGQGGRRRCWLFHFSLPEQVCLQACYFYTRSLLLKQKLGQRRYTAYLKK